MAEQRKLVAYQFMGDFCPINSDGTPYTPEPFVERLGDGLWGVFCGANETWIGPSGNWHASMAGYEWDAEAGDYVRCEPDSETRGSDGTQ